MSELGAAQSEAQEEARSVTMAGRAFVLPPKMPPLFLVGMGRFQRGDMGGYEDAIRSVLRDQTDEYLALPDATLDDLQLITAAYGMGEGESSASRMPLTDTGAPSRPTSNGSTASNWGQPSSLPTLP